MSSFSSFYQTIVNADAGVVVPEQYQNFLYTQNTSTKIRILFLSSFVVNECVFRDFGILPLAAVSAVASVFWSNFCLTVRLFMIASLFFIWCVKTVKNSVSDEALVRKYLAVIQALFPVLMSLMLSVVIIVELFAGSMLGHNDVFQYSPTYFAQFGLQAYPLLIFFALRDTHPVAVLLSWIIALMTLFACSMYLQSVGAFLSVTMYAAISATVFIDHHCQQGVMRSLWNRLQITQAEKEALSMEAEAQELRAMIGNVAHDLKTPLTSFLSGTEFMNDIVQDWESDLLSDKKEKFLREAPQKIQALRTCLVNMNSTNSFMTMTINRCLDYTKASNGFKLVPKLETVELRAMLDLPVKLIHDTHSHNNVQIRIAPIDASICAHIITDRQWLIENLLCLLSNAAKYSNKGFIDVSVELVPNPFHIAKEDSDDSGQPDADEVSTESPHYMRLRFHVLDTGVGLSEEAMQNLFSPFRQAQRLAGGTGLGLFSLAKRVEAIRGQYGVTRRPDGVQGSMFWFTIPYRPDTVSASLVERADKDAAVKSSPTARAESHNRSAPLAAEEVVRKVSSVPDSNRFRVMIADDAPLVIKMVSMLLHNKGHIVADKAINGVEALEKLIDCYNASGSAGKPPFDVVLMDLQMPVLDGIEAIRRLRTFEDQQYRQKQQKDQQEQRENAPAVESASQLGPNPGKLQPLAPIHIAHRSITSRPYHQFVVAFSANSDHETKQAAMEAGADAFLTKPFSYKSFMEVVNSAQEYSFEMS